MVDKDFINWDKINKTKTNKRPKKLKSSQGDKSSKVHRYNESPFNALQKNLFKDLEKKLDKLLDDQMETDSVSMIGKIYNELHSHNDSFYENFLFRFVSPKQDTKKFKDKSRKLMTPDNLTESPPLNMSPKETYPSVISEKIIPEQQMMIHNNTNPNLLRAVTLKEIPKEKDHERKATTKLDKQTVMPREENFFKKKTKKTGKTGKFKLSEGNLNKLPLIHDKFESSTKQVKIKNDNVAPKRIFPCLPFCF